MTFFTVAGLRRLKVFRWGRGAESLHPVSPGFRAGFRRRRSYGGQALLTWRSRFNSLGALRRSTYSNGALLPSLRPRSGRATGSGQAGQLDPAQSGTRRARLSKYGLPRANKKLATA